MAGQQGNINYVNSCPIVSSHSSSDFKWPLFSLWVSFLNVQYIVITQFLLDALPDVQPTA